MGGIGPDAHLIVAGPAAELRRIAFRRSLHQHTERFTYVPPVAFERQAVLQCYNLLEAAVLDFLGHVVGKLPCRKGAGALGIIEHKRGVKTNLLEDGEGVLVILLRLRAEAGDDIRSDGTVGHIAAYCRDPLQIPLTGVAPAHLLQYTVGAGLDGKVDVAADIVVRRHHLQHLIGYILGIGSGKAYAQSRQGLRNHTEQAREVAVTVAVGIDVLAEQGDFLVAPLEALAGLADD